MAYVTLTWDYGDDTVIDGFRIYRNGVLRGSVGPTVRTIDDTIDDATTNIASYSVRAYDDSNRESYGCSDIEVRLMSLITPDMTSQTTPSGNAFATYGGGLNFIDEGFVAFDRGNDFVEIRGAQAGEYWEASISYEFAEVERLTAWGLLTSSAGAVEFFTNPSAVEVKLYGSNDSGLGTLIDTLTYDFQSAENTEYLKFLDSKQYFKKYTLVYEDTIPVSGAVNPLTKYTLLNEILLYDSAIA